jgi:hypothetical protein
MNFKIGDKVRIIKNTSHHCWNIGQIVTCTKMHDKSYNGNNTGGG